MSVYLDASAILPTLIAEPSSQAMSRFLTQVTEPVVVSEFAAIEVASGLSRLTRMGQLDRGAAIGHLADLDRWRAAFTVNLDIQASDARIANAFVRRFDLGLRGPDALHAAVCLSGDPGLVTLDERLAAAARTLGVRIVSVA